MIWRIHLGTLAEGSARVDMAATGSARVMWLVVAAAFAFLPVIIIGGYVGCKRKPAILRNGVVVTPRMWLMMSIPAVTLVGVLCLLMYFLT